MQPDGALALTRHPAALGSPLTHPHITTDFSEAQLELVTGVHAGVETCLEELTQIHQFVYHAIGDEMLWVGSMPCGLPSDEAIPIGQYGTSNVGRAKSVYRMGLSHRYGRRMQTISGIHYNWSMPGISNQGYFALIRNFRRHSFLLLYLFGASPAVCSSFVSGRKHELQELADQTLHTPYGTSLRMGRLGYQSDAQSSLTVSYNSLESYGASLQEALTRPYPPYDAVGIRNAAGDYNQLATSLLQIENEFYGTIRPKRVIFPGERPLHALRERGVEYVEVRCMDLDPFVPIGIGPDAIRFLDVFLLHCLLTESPPDTPQEIAALARNQQRAAAHGRQPGLSLERGGTDALLTAWGEQVIEECTPIAAALDAVHGGANYCNTLMAAVAALHDADAVPSSRVLSRMAKDFDNSYVRFIQAQSERTKDILLNLPFSADISARFTALAQESIEEQQRVEAADTTPFEVYREKYQSTERLVVPSKLTSRM